MSDQGQAKIVFYGGPKDGLELILGLPLPCYYYFDRIVDSEIAAEWRHVYKLVDRRWYEYQGVEPLGKCST